jgi:hypothetical protein
MVVFGTLGGLKNGSVDNISPSTITVGPDQAPAVTLPSMGMLDQNLHIHD